MTFDLGWPLIFCIEFVSKLSRQSVSPSTDHKLNWCKIDAKYWGVSVKSPINHRSVEYTHINWPHIEKHTNLLLYYASYVCMVMSQYYLAVDLSVYKPCNVLYIMCMYDYIAVYKPYNVLCVICMYDYIAVYKPCICTMCHMYDDYIAVYKPYNYTITWFWRASCFFIGPTLIIGEGSIKSTTSRLESCYYHYYHLLQYKTVCYYHFPTYTIQ